MSRVNSRRNRDFSITRDSKRISCGAGWMNGAQTNTQGDPVKVQRCQRRSEVIMHCQKQLQEDSKCEEESWLADWIDEIQRADSQCIVKKVHHWKLQVPEET